MFKHSFREVFPMETLSWASQFKVLEKILEILGYTALKKSSSATRFHLSCALRFLIICLLPCFSLLSILKEENYHLRFDSMLSLVVGIHVLTKFIFLWLHKTKREKLSKYVIEATSDLCIGNESYKDIGEKYQLFSTKTMACTFTLYIMGIIVYSIFSLFALPNQWKLPLQSPIFGISYQNHPGYEINFLFILLQGCLFIPCCMVFDVLFYLNCSFTVLTFEVCKMSCVYIGDKKGEYNTEEKQRKLVQYLVKMHSNAVEFLNEFKAAFETIVLATIATFMGMGCIMIVQLSSDKQLEAGLGLFVAASQLLLYSSFGQMIISKRLKFAEAIYCSKWYELNDISTRKMVLLMLINAQRCEGIHLKGFSDLSLEAYCEIVKACYSFAAFLMNMM